MWATVGLALAGFGGAALVVEVWGARAAPAATADAIVVMGCPPNPDGSISDCLIRRVDRGAALWKEGRAPKLVLTGGERRGLEAEARVAARRALDLGVPGEALIVEPSSVSTWENARHTVAIASPRSVIVVTDNAHVLRATWCFQALGVEATGSGVEGAIVGRITGALREVAALIDYGSRGRLPKRPPSAAPT